LEIVGKLVVGFNVFGRDLQGRDEVVERLVGEALDKRLEVRSNLLDLFVLVGNVRLGLDLVDGRLGTAGILFDNRYEGSDGPTVLGVALGLLDNLLISLCHC
jgi:hypothetical protein